MEVFINIFFYNYYRLLNEDQVQNVISKVGKVRSNPGKY